MKNKYEKMRMKLINLLKLTILLAIPIFGIALSSYSQTLVTNPADGHYCEGGIGVEICVENTVIGQNYYVMHNGDTLNCIVGDGGTVCCAGFTDPGVYTTDPATNTVMVYVDPLPTKPTIVGNLYLCGYYMLTTYNTYNNLPTSDYTFVWQAFGYVNSGSLVGFYALPDDNSLDVIWGNADWGTIQVTVTDNATGCQISSDVITVNICQPITNNVIYGDTSICHLDNACFTGDLPSGGCDDYTYLWQVSTDGTTWNPAWCCNPSSNQTDVLYCTPDLAGPATYNIRRIVQGLACESISNELTLVVYAEFVVDPLIPDKETICYNSVPSCIGPVVASGGDGSYTYQWYGSTDNTTFTAISGEINATLCPPALLDDMWYYCEVTNLCGVINTNTYWVEVYDQFMPGVIGDDQTICYNTIPNLLYFITNPSGGNGTYSYQWQMQPNCLGNWMDITGATGTTYQPPALTDTTCYKVIVTDDQCDTLPTNIITIKVWDEFILDLPLLGDTSICYNTAPGCLGPVIAHGGQSNGSGYLYQWYNGAGAILGEINPTLCLDSLLVTDSYYCEVTDPCGVLTTNPVTITVWDDFDQGTIGFVPNECTEDSVDICYGTVPPCITFCPPGSTGGQPGIYSYQWYNSTDGVAFAVLPSETSDTLCPPALYQHTYYKCQVTNLCATGVTNIVKVHVWDPFVAGNIGFDPSCDDADTVCYNTAPDCIIECVAPTGGNTADGYTYEWYESLDAITFSKIVGETNSGYCPPALTADYWYYRLDMNKCDSLSTDTVHVKVWPIFVAGTVGDDQVICYNTVPDSLVELTPATGGDGVYTYQWQEDVLCLGNWTDITGATEAGYQPLALTDTTCFRRMDMNFCDTLPTNVVTIEVWNNLLSGTIGDDQTICSNTIPLPLYFLTTPTGGECNDVPSCYTYQWKESVNCTGTWVDITVNGTNATYQPPALTDTTCYKVEVTDTKCGSVMSNIITINVWDSLNVGNVGFDPNCALADTVCYNTAPACIDFCVLPSGGEPGVYTYQWMSSIDMVTFNPVLGAENPQYCPPALLETTYYKCQVTNPCEVGVTNVVTAYVWAEFVAGDIIADQEICYNTAPNCLFFNNPPTGGDTIVGYTYQWYDSFGLIAGAINPTYCPPALLLTETYYCEVTNPCGVLNTDTLTITVWDEFFAGQIGFVDPVSCLQTDTICKFFVPECIVECQPATGGSPAGYTYKWYESIDNVSFTEISGAVNIGYCPPALDTTTWYKRLDMNFCDSLYTNIVEVYVHELPPPFTITGDTMVCANTTGLIYCVDPPDSSYYYSWSVQGGLLDPNNCCGVCSVIDWGLGPLGTIIITKEDPNTGCTISDTLYVQINPIPNPIITGPIIVDEGDTVVYSVPVLPNYYYNWFITGGSVLSGGGTNAITVVWGMSGQGTVLVSVTDMTYPTHCCGHAQVDVTINPVGLPSISGNVTYNNAYNTPLNNVNVDLRDMYGVVMATTSTHFDFVNGLGYYEFYNIPDGNYTLDVSTNIPIGGVNATDALAIKFHSIAQPGFILTGLPLTAADVNLSGTVNATDALYVVYRTINYITAFPSGDWAFDNVPVTLAGSPITNDFMAECYGDVNMSYIPSGYKSSFDYELLVDGIKYIEPGSEFELPVRIDRETIMGAMTLNFSYSDELVDVIDITVPDNDNMLYTIEDGIIRIGWANTSALYLNADDVVVTLKLKALTDFTSADQLIALSDGVEFADEYAGVIASLSLKMAQIETSFGTAGYALSHNYPNPFMEYTDIEYTIPETGKVVINVYDVLGNKISTLVDASQDAGTYTTRFIVNDNNPGVYIYELQVEGVTSNYNILRKMVIR